MADLCNVEDPKKLSSVNYFILCLIVDRSYRIDRSSVRPYQVPSVRPSVGGEVSALKNLRYFWNSSYPLSPPYCLAEHKKLEAPSFVVFADG